MIVNIFDPTPGFTGVRYNTNKVERDKGELMKVANFGALQGLDNRRPEDYLNYLKMVSARGKQVKLPQFHAVISTTGRAHDKYALTNIAETWLERMGYGEQPYLIVFHKDTSHNHVHMVSTRVDRNGVKIPSDYEHVKAVRRLNEVMGLDEGYTARQDIEKALSYGFSTKAQFIMILESQGYQVKEDGAQMKIIKFGYEVAEMRSAGIHDRIKGWEPRKDRIRQLRAIFEKYGKQKDASLRFQTLTLPGGLSKLTGIYTSDLADYLKAKMGLVLIFHARKEMPPYGYTIIDHAEKAVFKGSQVMALQELINNVPLSLRDQEETTHQHHEPNETRDLETRDLGPEDKDYYGALLKAALHNYPDLGQGLRHQALRIEKGEGVYRLKDDSGTDISITEILTAEDRLYFIAEFEQMEEVTTGLNRQPGYVASVSIAEDIDDEQINGRNRRRKRKARTNTR